MSARKHLALSRCFTVVGGWGLLGQGCRDVGTLGLAVPGPSPAAPAPALPRAPGEEAQDMLGS